MIRPLPASRGAARIAARSRHAAIVLALAVAMLAGVAGWLVARERTQVWAAAHRSQEGVALAVQSSISALVAQSVMSLRAVQDALAAAPPPARLRVLREAARLDSLSAYLGVAVAGDVTLVDAQGRVRAGMAPELARAGAGDAVRFGAVLQLPGDASWYVPVALRAPAGDEALVFALVPVERLVGAAASLKALPGSYVTLFTRSGVRLFRKTPSDDTLSPNGKPVPAAVLALVNAQPQGSFARISTVDGRPTIYGYSASAGLPLVVTTGLPESLLERQWLARALAPFGVLLAGVAGIVVFGLRLRSALGEQLAYATAQEYLASHDLLTGLPNRYAFLQHLEQRVAGPAGERGLCVLLLDVNRFRDVDDTLAHDAGDTLLQALGERLAERLRPAGVFVARLGDDELGLCAAHVHVDDAAAVEAFCETVHRVLEEPLVSAGIELAVTASIGVATWPADASSAQALLRCAEIAMRRARQDLARRCRYTPGMR